MYQMLVEFIFTQQSLFKTKKQPGFGCYCNA